MIVLQFGETAEHLWIHFALVNLYVYVTVQPSMNIPSWRASERVGGWAGGRVGGRAGGRAGERAGERASGRAGERAGGRAGCTLRQVVVKRKCSTTTTSTILLTDLSTKHRMLRLVYRWLDKEVVLF